LTGLQQDPWLGAQLGKPAFSATSQIDRKELPRGPAFVSAKVDVSEVLGLLRLQHLGFQVIDTNVQMMRSAAAIAFTTNSVRFARSEDENDVRATALEAFVHDRFHRDPEIAADTASRIKAEWAGNFFSGRRGDWMVVAVADGRPRAFLQILRDKADALAIDLIAVSPKYQRRGFAGAMINFAVKACLGKVAPMRVGTQIANIPSLGLYAGLGFEITSASYVLHMHR
jgi:ribosomal protein S18 acetylase RimI-like enzyme